MIEATRKGGVLCLTLDRPDKANAITREMLRELIDEIETEREARVLMITGRGRTFSAGADRDEVAQEDLASAEEWERLSAAVESFEGLSIAVLNGAAVGGALGMVLACDLRVGAPETRIFYPVMRLGHLPPSSDPKRLSALIGPSRAKLILLTGARLGAEDALTIGLVDHLADNPMTAAADLARDVLETREGHAAQIKRMI